MVKTCRCCLVDVPVDQFSPEPHKGDGLASYCRPCVAAKARRRRTGKGGCAHPPLPSAAERRVWAHRLTSATHHAKQWGVLTDLTLVQWLQVLREHEHRCAYCGSDDRLELEHVVPIHRGGGHTRSNVVPACHACNFKKSRRNGDEFAAGVCLNGHEMTEENTYRYPDSAKTACRTCRATWVRDYRDRIASRRAA